MKYVTFLKSIILPFLLFLVFILFLFIRFDLTKVGYHYWDENAFRKAAATLVNYPLSEYYQRVTLMEVGFLPVIPLCLWVIGFIYRGYIDPAFGLDTALSPTLLLFLKFPAILFDVLSLCLIYLLLYKRVGKIKASLSALFYFISPAVIYLSSYWGQFESIYGFFLLLTLYFLKKRNYYGSFLAMSFSILTKPQAILFLPVFLLYVIYMGKLRIKDFFWGCVLSLIPFLIILPFSHGNPIFWLLSYFIKLTTETTFVTSAQAFNFWGLTTGFNTPLSDVFLNLSYKTWGNILFGGFYIIVLTKLLLSFRQGRNWFLKGLFLIYFGFFILAPQIHERYLFPAILFLNLLIWDSKIHLSMFVILSAIFIVNLTSAWSEFPGFFTLMNKGFLGELTTWLKFNHGGNASLILIFIFLTESIFLIFSRDRGETKKRLITK